MSNNYVIVVDSTTDLPDKLANDLGLVVIPYIYTLDNKEYHNYLDYRELSVKDFYDTLRAGKTGSTTQVTAHRYMETWKPFLEEGKDILYMCLSSALSKSYEQSMLAAQQAQEEYPNNKVITIDSRSATLGQGLLAYYAAKARDEGKSLDELAKYIQEDLIPNLHHWAIVDDLHHLRRGGRVSGASAFVGTLIQIKPILSIVDDGRLVPLHKARGHSKAFQYGIKCMHDYGFQKDHIVGIAHSDAPELANKLKEEITAEFGVNDFIINEIGPVIGAHTGPGTIALIFLAKGRPTAK